MLVENLYRVLVDNEIIYLYSVDDCNNLWHGVVSDIPNCYMKYNVHSMYTHTIDSGTCLVVNIEAPCAFKYTAGCKSLHRLYN